jgi:cysteinyl-tRNA synthetase
MRLTLLSTHYRQPFDWTSEGLQSALKTLDKWYEALSNNTSSSDTPDSQFMAALYDDMNTPLAISILHKLAKDNPQSLAASANVMGLLTMSAESWFALRKQTHNTHDESQIQMLIDQRNAARVDKNFTLADNIRGQLDSMGIIIKDGDDGTSWNFK